MTKSAYVDGFCRAELFFVIFSIISVFNYFSKIFSKSIDKLIAGA